ncbi:MAG: hypothetical protein LBH74_00775 [Nitrososphaerota archaeon]|nr:hypothetical protein [Nitrososphaerota archaeon]
MYLWVSFTFVIEPYTIFPKGNIGSVGVGAGCVGVGVGVGVGADVAVDVGAGVGVDLEVVAGVGVGVDTDGEGEALSTFSGGKVPAGVVVGDNVSVNSGGDVDCDKISLTP